MRPRITTSISTPRRVRVDDLDERTLRLRGANRRLASALDQLRSGVPLNWGQVEDDPEMATLARLQLAGQECRAIPMREPSPGSRAALIEQLARRLPAPRTKQEKAPPKSLAGFSENVQVLTQVEDNISLGINWPLTILRGLAGLAVVVLVVWGIASFLKANSTPSFSWIQALRGGQPASRMAHTFAQSSPLPCQVARMDNPTRPGFYIPVQSLRDAQANVDYNIPLLPESISVPTTYTFQLILASVDPCEGNTLKPSDPAALIALQYEVRRLTADPNATSTPNGLGRPGGIRATVATVVMFSSHEQPSYIDVTSGSWNEVTLGDLHGLHWRGNPYRDPSGAQWNGDVNVLVVEHEDTVVTLVGSNIEGITEQMLTEVARNISW
jgi:hypothetical protein